MLLAQTRERSVSCLYMDLQCLLLISMSVYFFRLDFNQSMFIDRARCTTYLANTQSSADTNEFPDAWLVVSAAIFFPSQWCGIRLSHTHARLYSALYKEQRWTSAFQMCFRPFRSVHIHIYTHTHRETQLSLILACEVILSSVSCVACVLGPLSVENLVMHWFAVGVCGGC